MRSALPVLLAILTQFPAVAEARSRGITGVGCNGCHGEHNNSSLALSPIVAEPGTRTTLRITLSDPDAQVAGLFIDVEDASAITIPSGQQLSLVDDGVVHTSPRAFSGGEVTYELSFDVPVTAGASRFAISSLSADGNGRNNSGDEGLLEAFDVVYGCEPQTFYEDLDRDGFGRSLRTRVFCTGAAPVGYGAAGDDCNDNDASVYPAAEEFCNRRDDNCDGVIDEGALPVEIYPDADGDGFFTYQERMSGDMVLGCVPYPGYADRGGDCDGENPAANPEGVELCDGIVDEDCDGRIDERVRPICGIGWCRRESASCSIGDCTPGSPSEEICNFQDDDCDDEVDEGELCPEGEECLAGECRPTELESPGAGGTVAPDAPPGESVGGGPAARPPSESPSGCQMSQKPSKSGLPWLFLGALASVLKRRLFRKGALPGGKP